MDSLFSNFTPTTKEQWLQQIEKELKGKPFSDLKWALGPDFSIEPFYTREDFPFPPPPQIFNEHPSSWYIGEQFDCQDWFQDNHLLLEALEGGVNAPGFSFKQIPKIGDLEILYKNVATDFISHHFELSLNKDDKAEDQVDNFLSKWNHFIRDKKVTGTFAHSDFESGSRQKYWEMLANRSEHLPGFRIIGLDLRQSWKGIEGIIGEVEVALESIVAMLESATATHEWSVLDFFRNLHIKINIGTSYFLEIAKLRALRLCLANLQKAYGLEEFQLPFFDVYFTTKVMEESTHTNMIKNTTMAMAAIIGGASRLSVLPANANIEPASPFTRRIARNVQHLLAMESNFGKVADPAAGSYYSEYLTQQIAEKAWKKLQV